MEICILCKEAQKSIYNAAYKLLECADAEFVPSLSSRSSSTQQELCGSAQNANGIHPYFEQLKAQRFAAAFENGKLIAFVSYKENYTCDEIVQNELPNIYISTLVVSPEARGKGVTKALYSALFSEYKTANVFTRTWSTNVAHIAVLKKFEFEEIHRIPNDRGVGIDTVYFSHRAKNEIINSKFKCEGML